MIGRRAQATLTGLLLAAIPMAPAMACNFSESGGALGSVSSFRVRNGPAITGSANTGFSCSGVVIAALTTPTVQAKITSATAGLTLKNGVNSIPYQITSQGGMPYTQGGLIINASGSNVLTLLNGGGSASVPLQITVPAGANVPAGVYTDTITVNWDYRFICEGLLGIGGICAGVMSNGNTDRYVTLQLTVTNDCTITAPNIVFGTAPLPSGFATVSQNLSLVCTSGLNYTVGLSGGGNPSAGRRQMASGANRLAYDIFQGSTATVWGALGAARVSAPGLANGLTPQLLPYNARVYTDQGAPPEGSYLDTVTVDVQF